MFLPAYALIRHRWSLSLHNVMKYHVKKRKEYDTLEN